MQPPDGIEVARAIAAVAWWEEQYARAHAQFGEEILTRFRDRSGSEPLVQGGMHHMIADYIPASPTVARRMDMEERIEQWCRRVNLDRRVSFDGLPDGWWETLPRMWVVDKLRLRARLRYGHNLRSVRVSFYLEKAGYFSYSALRAASDEELLAVPYVGPKELGRIRALLATRPLGPDQRGHW